MLLFGEVCKLADFGFAEYYKPLEVSSRWKRRSVSRYLAPEIISSMFSKDW